MQYLNNNAKPIQFLKWFSIPLHNQFSSPNFLKFNLLQTSSPYRRKNITAWNFSNISLVYYLTSCLSLLIRF